MIYTPKLAHVFVHFFKIGGGESYLHNFNKFNLLNNSIFHETLFINKNCSSETLFTFNFNIIYYDDYHHLNQLLNDFDIIIDHQLYWYDIEISKIAFYNIIFEKIIRITHGVPIHFKNINDLNYYYSVELYNEIGGDDSWNNHIKIYNNIGVNNMHTNNIEKFDKSSIKVSIIGRIYEDKVPIKFLKLLPQFSKCYPNYIFNFYGNIDENYYKTFFSNINKSKNIKYINVIDPCNMDNVYLNTHILLHPSKMEAGATVILEACSYGIPVIARKCNGIINAMGNDNVDYLCINDAQLFEKLLLINEDNYEEISKKNILKIANHNNQEKLFNQLLRELRLVYEYQFESTTCIPNIIHYIYGLKEQNEEFPFVYYLSILSNYLINKPYIIYFHYQYLPYGKWWNEALKYVKLNYINASNMYWKQKKIIKYAHKADKIRLEMLLKYGGIYMDIDTITYRPYFHLLNYDFVVGIQEEYNSINQKTLYCNAILMSVKNNKFIEKWINNYENTFDPNGWCESSIHLLSNMIIDEKYTNNINIKIVEKETFYYPSYDETDKIFEKTCSESTISPKLLTLHYWNTYSKKYYNEIVDFNYKNSSMYSILVQHIYNIKMK